MPESPRGRIWRLSDRMTPTWLSTTQGVLSLAPTILQLIIALEGLFPKKDKAGAQKKALVMSAITGADPETTAAASAFVDSSVKQLFPQPAA